MRRSRKAVTTSMSKPAKDDRNTAKDAKVRRSKRRPLRFDDDHILESGVNSPSNFDEDGLGPLGQDTGDADGMYLYVFK